MIRFLWPTGKNGRTLTVGSCLFRAGAAAASCSTPPAIYLLRGSDVTDTDIATLSHYGYKLSERVRILSVYCAWHKSVTGETQPTTVWQLLVWGYGLFSKKGVPHQFLRGLFLKRLIYPHGVFTTIVSLCKNIGSLIPGNQRFLDLKLNYK